MNTKRIVISIVLLLAVALMGAQIFYVQTMKEHLFVDATYGFKFVYPSDWMVTSDANNLASNGIAFQLSNFKHADSALPDPTKGQNIVYGDITYTTLAEILNNINNCHGDCDPNIFATSTTVAGRDTVIVLYKLKPDAPISGYSIDIASPNFPKAVLGIGITGDPANFHQLQNMLSSLQLTK